MNTDTNTNQNRDSGVASTPQNTNLNLTEVNERVGSEFTDWARERRQQFAQSSVSLPQEDVSAILTQALNVTQTALQKISGESNREHKFIQRVKNRQTTLTTTTLPNVLKEVIQLAEQHDLSFPHFLGCVPDIADKPFKNWITHAEIKSYTQLTEQFLQKFVPEGRERRLRKRIMTEVQGGRSIKEYFALIANLNADLDSPLTESELVDTILDGLNPQIRLGLGVSARQKTLALLEEDCLITEKLGGFQKTAIEVEAFTCFNCGDPKHFIKDCPKPGIRKTSVPEPVVPDHTSAQTIANQLSELSRQVAALQAQITKSQNFQKMDREGGETRP